MTDVLQVWGNDLVFSASGNLTLATGAEEGRERVLRRLMTCAEQYLWDKAYGAGLPRLVGLVPTEATIRGTVLSQMLLEAAAAASPPPVIGVTPLVNGQGGYSIDISYTDAITGDPIFIGFDIGGGS